MKILFVGTVIPEELSVSVKSNSLAGNKFQSKIINYMRNSHEVDVFSFVAVPITEEDKENILKHSDKNNIYFLKKPNTIKSILRYRRELKKVSKNYDLIIACNVVYAWLNLPKFNKNTMLLLSDFSDSNSYSNILLKCYAKICKHDIRKYKYVVGLSEDTKFMLKKKQKFICIPGGIDLKDYKNTTLPKIDGKLKVMYSGALEKVTGVDLLIEAINKTKFDNFELIITGRGSLESFVKEKQNEKIKYYGSLPYEEYIKLLNSANILVNPRNMNLPENKNNFPSKVLDYLAVGKVVLSTKFIGYKNFENNFIFCDSNAESIMNKLEFIIENYTNIYENYYNLNREKTNEFDWKNQVQKMIDMIQK